MRDSDVSDSKQCRCQLSYPLLTERDPGSRGMKGESAPEMGCCHKTQPLGSTGSSLSSSPDFQLCQGNQVSSARRPLPDTVDAHGSSCASWLCPLPLAPAKSALLTCPQGLDLYLCALQPASLGMAPRGLRSDTLSTTLQPPGLHAGSTDGEKLTAKHSASRDQRGSQWERAGEGACCPSFCPHSSSCPPPWQNRRSPIPLAFCSCLSCLLPTPISKELPFCLHPFCPAYPLLPPPYLLTYGALPSVRCPRLFMRPPDPSHPIMAMPSLLMSVNEPGPPTAQRETLYPYPGASQASGQIQPFQAWNPGPGTARTYSSGQKSAGRAAPARRTPLGSRTGTAALPYPLKKENGKILYECNVCGKNFGQLSNLKVSASWAPLLPSPRHPSTTPCYPASRIKGLEARATPGQPLGCDLGCFLWPLGVMFVERRRQNGRQKSSPL
ncbi:tissue-resident T-cell transcription regulator protein ZNF683 [Prionailurus bengalensis]|uniref:tissue-resident T-cell transcription regulator protein ZNF683 n=1 Tax=Prionailurus bengalensis TaxID=37029 RepID=UPI001CA8C98F|nr:tissue-resident T-cell transcription regulator protein ZNF683 [Prionailurus bengalensis]